MTRAICALLLTSTFVSLPLVNAAAQTGTTLSGKVTQGENNQPMAGALIVIDELRRETTAGEDGSYRFDNVPPGQYHVGVQIGRAHV